MSPTIIYTIITLSSVGVLAALILFFVAKKFHVIEDPRIDEVEGMLPGANCGGCGFPGCRKFAQELVTRDNIEDLYCAPGGSDSMLAIASFLGKATSAKKPQVAVVRCQGSCDNRPRTNIYDGATSCKIASGLYGGDTACSYGCLGHGDCVTACNFDAIYIDEQTLLPVVSTDNCTACGACVTACPKHIIELRNTNKKDLKIFVSCINEDKGAVARKACTTACIGCGKCVKVCPHDAIVVENFLAYIDFEKCKLCRKCVEVCPTSAIVETNFPPRKKKTETETESNPAN